MEFFSRYRLHIMNFYFYFLMISCSHIIFKKGNASRNASTAALSFRFPRKKMQNWNLRSEEQLYVVPTTCQHYFAGGLQNLSISQWKRIPTVLAHPILENKIEFLKCELHLVGGQLTKRRNRKILIINHSFCEKLS